jgi:hypothetical protein
MRERKYLRPLHRTLSVSLFLSLHPTHRLITSFYQLTCKLPHHTKSVFDAAEGGGRSQGGGVAAGGATG